MALHQAQDKRGTDDALEPKSQARIVDLRKEAARTREFLANNPPRTNRQGQELKTIAGRGRQVTRFESKPKDPTNPSDRMRQAIDSPRGRGRIDRGALRPCSRHLARKGGAIAAEGA